MTGGETSLSRTMRGVRRRVRQIAADAGRIKPGADKLNLISQCPTAEGKENKATLPHSDHTVSQNFTL